MPIVLEQNPKHMHDRVHPLIKEVKPLVVTSNRSKVVHKPKANTPVPHFLKLKPTRLKNLHNG